jgi:predicted DCC family thiol-disulfide oxidoreductase YuxK
MNTPHFTLLYDGHCPICIKEVAWLSRRNRAGHLLLQDIHAADFDPKHYGTSIPHLMAIIHGINADGQLVQGMAVFRASYAAVGLGWLMAPTGWPLLRPLFDRLYALFARHRIGLGNWLRGGCDDNSCAKP